MKTSQTIITIGLCPSWDRRCELDGIEWGQHRPVTASQIRPAGKAMNISRALAWMGPKNIAAGLWGAEDYPQLQRAMTPLRKQVRLIVTPVPGSTRRNITVVDTRGKREMHLRHTCSLASQKAIQCLRTDLHAIVKKGHTCVFSGRMPTGQRLSEILQIIESCARTGAKIVVDTAGTALHQAVETHRLQIIKPNIAELREFLGRDVPDTPKSLVSAVRPWLDKVPVILVSRGAKGAVLVTRHGAWQGRYPGRARVLSTVGCGDYMLAGFLVSWSETLNPILSLETAIQAGTAKAFDRTEADDWEKTRKRILPVIRPCSF